MEECIKKAQDCGSDLFCIAQVGLECEGVSPPVLRSNNGKIENGKTKIFRKFLNIYLVYLIIFKIFIQTFSFQGPSCDECIRKMADCTDLTCIIQVGKECEEECSHWSDQAACPALLLIKLSFQLSWSCGLAFF